MDRRDFFKTIFASPLLTPLLLASSFSSNDELFLLADRPEIYLPVLLEELGMGNIGFVRSSFSLNAHPRKKALSQALKTSGWTQASQPQKADLTLSFRPLQHPSPPSFTRVSSGQIWDVRTKKLLSLWREMNKKNPPSSCLTVASLQTKQTANVLGNSARFCLDGRVIEEVSLKKDRVKTFRAKNGNVNVKIEQGKVSVLSSSCRHKICCSVSPICFTGERIVCAPNHFLLEIKGPRLVDTVIG
jgi:hypothetical protein